MRKSVGASSSTRWRSTKAAAWREYAKFCDELDVDARTADANFVLLYLQNLLDTTRLAASTLASRASAIGRARYEHGAPEFTPEQAKEKLALLKSFRKSRPSGRPHAMPNRVADLIDFLPRGNSYDAVLTRAIFGLRAVTMMRPTEPISVKLSSVRTNTNLNGSEIVCFHYLTKSAVARGVSHDTNYIEFIDESSPHAWACPATALLVLQELVVLQAAALGKPLPESICVSERLEPLSGSRVSAIVHNVMRTAGWQTKSKDLRRIAQQNLRAWRSAPPQCNSIPADDVDLRGNWASKSSAVQHAHYNDYRLVADNFASALYSS